MARLSKEIITKLVDEKFFGDWRTLEEVLIRLDQKGFTIKEKKKGLLAQLLAYLCQDSVLERERIEDAPKLAPRWKYRKFQNQKSD
jgi:hypothetical protein